MTLETSRAVAVWSWRVSIAFNAVLFVSNCWRGAWGLASVQLLVIAGSESWLALRPRLDDWWDAKVAHARAERDTAQLMFDVFKAQAQRGDVHVDLTATRERVN